MDYRSWGTTKNCKGCRYWSEMMAMANGPGVEAFCLSQDGKYAGKYTPGRQTCDHWKSGHHGAVDQPPNYGEATRALYEAEEVMNQ